MIGGDARSLKQGTSASERLALQRSAVEQLDVFVWPQVHSVFAILSAARTIRYDVVTVQDPFWRGLVGWCIARLSGARLNVQVHTDLTAYKGAKHVCAQIVLRHADSIRVVSDKIKTHVEKIGVRTKITVLPVFVDVSVFSSVTRRPHDGKNILWVGRFEEEKNPIGAIQVLREVLQKESRARLVMLGDGSLRQTALEEAANLSAVEMLGFQSPIAHLETADVVLCTSWHESWGQSIVEALAAGVPVVAPDVGVAREAGAIVVPRENLADIIVKVLNDSPQAQLKLSLPDAHEWTAAWKESLQ